MQLRCVHDAHGAFFPLFSSFPGLVLCTILSSELSGQGWLEEKKNSFLKPCLLYILLFTLVSKRLMEEMACSGFVIILVSRWALHCFWPQRAALVVANGLTSAKLTSSSNLVWFGHLWDTNTSHCIFKSWISSCKFSSFSSAKYWNLIFHFH